MAHTHFDPLPLGKTETELTDLTVSDITAIHDNVAAEIVGVTEKTVPAAADLLLIEDSAASNVKKSLKISNLLEETIEFSTPRGENLAVRTGASRWYPPYDITIVDVSASVGTAPTGATILIDVNKNGTTIFTTQSNRPTIAISGFFDVSGTPEVTSLTGDTDYLTVDIDQIGSTIAGVDLVVQVRYTRA